jgi:ferrous iron transport protein B
MIIIHKFKGDHMKLALVGNPNSGKTTLFNLLTGKNEHVGNWAGVTVSKKEALLSKKYKHHDQTLIVDLPGAYSMSAYTSEETITHEYILNENVNCLINIIDGLNLERSLFMTTQLASLGIPMVIAINKSDLLLKRGDKIDLLKLSAYFDCPVVEVSALHSNGLVDLIDTASQVAKQKQVPNFKPIYHTMDQRQEAIKALINEALSVTVDVHKENLSDRIDAVVAHRFWGLPIFFMVMWAVYAFSIEGLGGTLSAYFNDVLFGEALPTAASNFLNRLSVAPLLHDLIVDGLIGGIGAVIGFLPLIMVLFFCLSLLEDSGYMSRVAVIMDQYFKKIGLSGKSIIPMIIGSGCAIPGVMATRTIEDVNEKRMTTMLTPFVPCGAKLPIIALFSAAFFPNQNWVGPSMYILAIALIIIGGKILKKIYVWENTSPFILELPAYKIPSLKHAFVQMLDKGKAFIYKASTIILVMNTLIWFMQAYSWKLIPVSDQGNSILASIGGVVSPLLIPLGFIGWQLAAATITGFIAKENVVSTFAILLAVTSEEALYLPGGSLTEFFTPVTAYAFLAFNLFTPPCFAAIGAMNSELADRRWLFKALAFQFSVGYIVALLITQIGTPLFSGHLAPGAPLALLSLILFAALTTYLIKRTHRVTSAIKTVKSH